MELNRISTEDVVVIEYMPAISISDESESVEVPAWIGCLDTKIDGLIVAGCYDGKIQLISTDGFELVNTTAAHEEPIRAITSWNPQNTNQNGNQNNSSSVFIATASKDQSLKCWSMDSQTKSKNSKARELVLAANLVVR